MGEVADAMLDGTLCAACGVALIDGPDDEPQGFPGYCSIECANAQGVDLVCDSPRRSPNARPAARQNADRQRAAAARKPFECGKCGKRFRTSHGVAQHESDKHRPKYRPATVHHIDDEDSGP